MAEDLDLLYFRLSELMFKMIRYNMEGESFYGVEPNFGVMGTQFGKNALKINEVTMNILQKWELAAKKLVKSESFVKGLYKLQPTSASQLHQAIMTQMVNITDNKQAMIQKLVDTYKGMQRGKVNIKDNENNSKYLYTAQVTAVALNTLFSLGLMTERECKVYMKEYIEQHSLPEKEAERLKNLRVKGLKGANDDGCHISEFSLKTIWDERG